METFKFLLSSFSLPSPTLLLTETYPISPLCLSAQLTQFPTRRSQTLLNMGAKGACSSPLLTNLGKNISSNRYLPQEKIRSTDRKPTDPKTYFSGGGGGRKTHICVSWETWSSKALPAQLVLFIGAGIWVFVHRKCRFWVYATPTESRLPACSCQVYLLSGFRIRETETRTGKSKAQ